jgi:hypothetical protein
VDGQRRRASNRGCARFRSSRKAGAGCEPRRSGSISNTAALVKVEAAADRV